MKKTTKLSQSPIFEELEPRMLFSADVAEALATDAVEQDIDEEPIVTADLETEAEANDVVVDQPEEVEVVESADPEVTEKADAENDTAEQETSDQPTNEAAETDTVSEQARDEEIIISDSANTNEESVETKVSDITESSEVVFVNDNVHEYELLVGDLLQEVGSDRTIEVIILDDTRNGIEQITQILQEHENLDAIHFISHGGEAQVSLGNSLLDVDSLGENTSAIQSWGDALSEDGDLFIYGCNIAASEDGQAFVDSIASLTGADVAATVDVTGHVGLGGDWELEYQTGEIDAGIIFSETLQETWYSTLTPPAANNDTVTTNVDTPVLIDVVNNDTDPEDDSIIVLQTTKPAHGTAINIGNGTINYIPDSSYFGTDNFDYLVTDISGTTHFWGLEGDVDDSIGSADGTLYNDPATIIGSFGNALSFDETDDYISIPNFSYNNEFSVSFNFKIDDNSGSRFQYIYSHGDITTDTESLAVFLREDGAANPGMLQTYFGDVNDPGSNEALQVDISSTGLDLVGDGAWHTYTLTVESGNGSKVYIDGNIEASDATRGGESFEPDGTLYLGGRQVDDGTRFYGGQLDSVQIFDKTLNAGEVSDLYNTTNNSATVTVTVNSAPTDIILTQATAVSIDNASFEDQVLSDSGRDNSVMSWTDSGDSGVWNPDSIGYTNEAPDGENVAYVSAVVGGETLSQELSETFVAGRSYILSAMIGDEIGAAETSTWQMRLYAGNQLLGSVTNADFNPAEDSFTRAVLHMDAETLSAFSTEYGQQLKIEFYNDDTGGGADIHIDDVQLEHTAISIAENAANGISVADITSVTDPNAGDTHTYSLTDNAGGRFAIDNITGAITVLNGSLLDYETYTSHNITVRATDSSGLTYDEVVTIQVSNVNEAPEDLDMGLTSTVDTLVNTTTDGGQSVARVSNLADGGYVVIWKGDYHQDGSSWGVYGQRYDVNGNTVDGEFLVNTTTDGGQYQGTVAGTADGGFVVTWVSGQDGTTGVYAQAYDSNGNMVGGEFHVPSITADVQQYPEISAFDGGGYIITWTSRSQDHGSSEGVYAQRFDALHNPVGIETLINTHINNNQQASRVATFSDDSYVIVWESWDQDGSGTGIYGQRFNSDASANGSEFLINTTTDGSQFKHHVSAFSDDSFVVTWYSNGDIFAQVFDSDGNKQGGEISVNIYLADDQDDPNVTGLPDGGFLISWTSQLQDGDGDGIFAQRFDALGNTVGEEFQLTDTSTGDQMESSLTTLNDGRVVAAWRGPDVNYSGIISKILSFQYVEENAAFGTVVGSAIVTDQDAGDTHTFTILADTSGGAFQIDANTGEVSVADGSLLDFETASSHNITIEVTDSGGLTYTEVLTVVVADVNDAPITGNASSGTLEDSTFAQINLNGTDVDGTVTHFKLNNLPANGVLYLDSDLTTAVETGFDYPLGGLVLPMYFVPNADWNGITTFNYLAKDDQGAYSTTTGTATINIVAVNDAPVMDSSSALSFTSISEDDSNNDGNTVAEILASSGGNPITDVDLAPLEGIALMNTVENNGLWQYSVDGGTNWTNVGSVDNSNALLLRDTDMLRFVPDGTTGIASSVGFRAWDQTSGIQGTKVNASPVGGITAFSSLTESAQINVSNINDAPELVLPTSQTVIEETSSTINGISLTDVDANNGLLTLRLQVANGELGVVLSGAATISSGSNNSNDLTLQGNVTDLNTTLDNLSYTGNTNETGQGNDTIWVTLNDQGNSGSGGAQEDTGTVSINITNVNDAPVITSTAPTTATEDTVYSYIPTVTDAENDTLTWAITYAPAGMSINETTGEVTWTPLEGVTTSGAVSITATDDGTPAESASETFTISVTAVNDAPVAVADTAATTENTAITIDVLANDTDPDVTDSHIVSGIGTALTTGTVTNNGTDVTYDPGAAYDYLAFGETATDSFTYTINDGQGGTDTATVTVTITGTNDAPVAVADSLATTENAAITIDVLANDTDPDLSDTHIVSAIDTALTNGTVINNGINVTYDPGASYDYLAVGETATDTFTYTIDDGNGGTDTATVTVTISGTNDAPVLAAIGNQTVDELAELTFTATSTDTDLPANTLTYSLDATSIATGMIIDANTGDFSWTPTENQDGAHSVTVTVTDDGTETLSDFETFTVTVSEVNTAPVLAAIGNQSVDELTELSFSVTTTDSGLLADTLSYTLDAASLAAGMVIDVNTGDFLWTPTELQDGVHTVTITVTDEGSGNLSDSETFSITVGEVNVAPENDDIDTGSDDGNTDNTNVSDDNETIIVVPPVDEEIQDFENEEKESDDIYDIAVADFENDQPGDEDSTANELLAEEGKNILKVNPVDTTQNVDSSTNIEDQTSDYYSAYKELNYQENESTNTARQIQKESYSRMLLKAVKTAASETLEFISPSVSAAPLYMNSPDPNGSEILNETMKTQLSYMNQEMDQAFENSAEEQKIRAYMASGMSASFAIGTAGYLLRGGSLLSSFLTTVPLWKAFDPVAILLIPKKKKKKDRKAVEENASPSVSSTEQKAENMFAGDENP